MTEVDLISVCSHSPLEEGDGLGVEAELVLGVLPLVAEHQHDPGVELGQGPGHVALPRLVEYRADEPEIEGVAGQGEDVPDQDHFKEMMRTRMTPPVRPGPVLQRPAGADL